MGTNRNIGLCIVLSIITCGIYDLYWFVVLTDETNAMSGRTEMASGVMALILTLVTCGIYGWYWAYKMGEKNDMIKGADSNSGIMFIILQALGLGFIAYCIIQDTINKNC